MQIWKLYLPNYHITLIQLTNWCFAIDKCIYLFTSRLLKIWFLWSSGENGWRLETRRNGESREYPTLLQLCLGLQVFLYSERVFLTSWKHYWCHKSGLLQWLCLGFYTFSVMFQMLNCIIGMVDKTKRALAVLQERSLRDREELSLWMRRHAEGMDVDMKKRSNDLMAHTLRQTEDRVSDVRRRAGIGNSNNFPLNILYSPCKLND